MSKKRIVVTGLGVVSCFGNDVELFFQNLLAGKSGVTPITQFPCEDYPTRFAAGIKEFDPGEYIDKKQARRVDRAIAYAMVAGKKSLEMANLSPESQEKLNKNRCGIIIGSGIGGMNTFSEGVVVLKEKGVKRLTPFLVPYILTNMPGALLGIDLAFMGPNYSISTACATSNYSIIAAAKHIQDNEADLMICGGTEACVIPLGLGGFCACKALSQRNEEPTKASRPWDKGRDGFVLGEGAGVIVLESLEHALSRGAPILAEYLGGGISCDAYHMTEPREDGKGIIECVSKALQDSRITSDQVNYINAHATSTPAGDMVELDALKKVFKNPEKISINSTKSMIGHALGAAGGLEAVATVMSIKEGKIHPTINLENPEPDIGFSVNSTEKPLPIMVAASNSFGFGGHNATIIFSRFS